MRAPFTRRVLAVGAVFVANGSLVGALWPRIPEFSERLEIGPAVLGWVFSLATAGSLAGSLAAPALMRRLGGIRAVRLSVLVYMAAAVAMFATRQVLAASLAFAVVGFVDGVVDVGMNVAASHLEAERPRPLMSRFHAAWAGGVLGFSVVSVLTIPLVSLAWLVPAIAVVTGAMAVVAVSGWDLSEGPAPSDTFARRGARLPLLVIGVVVALGTVVESVPSDWGALAVEARFSPDRTVAGLAVVLTLTGMIIGRLAGDRVVGSFGAKRSLAGFMALAATGLGLIVWASALGQALLGFWLVGVGTATVFPISIILATRVAGAGRERAVSVASAAARMALLATPLVVGPVAEIFGFGPAFVIPLVLAGLVAAWAAASGRTERVG